MSEASARKAGRGDKSQFGLARRVAPIMADAEEQGFFDTKDSRITARLSRKLVDAAKEKTGIESDSELVKFAIAQIALDDPFRRAFRELGGTVDPTLDLEI
jgi:hypothetical protein